MPNVSLVYSDRWGEILDRPADDCVEIRWFDTTSDMDGDDFDRFLTRCAEQVEACGRSVALVDTLEFGMDILKMDMSWRDEHVVPRYNVAGLKKLAYVVPPDVHMIETPPSTEGRATFRTGYFGTWDEALAWLKE